MLIFADIFGDSEHGFYHQKESQVETQAGLEETVIRRDHGERTAISPAGSSVLLVSSSRAALTFDDGPDPVWSPQVLDALRRADAHATFFVVAPLALEHPRIISAMLEAGHGVEFHCTEHARHTHRSRHEVEADTREGLETLQRLGVEPRFWRPPWGVLAPWTEEVAEDFGLRLAPWSADTRDWRGDPVPQMLRRIKPLLGPGSIVLMHDALGPGALRTGCEETASLVEPLVAHLRSIDCEPVPITLLDVPVRATATTERREVEA